MSERGIKFKEGDIHEFRIKNLVEMSGMEKYYVLEDKKGGKQMLNAEYYESYNFKIGDTVRCRVDHINCSGRIFLEPEHPYYKEGEEYEFVVDEIDVIHNKMDISVFEVRVRDIFGGTAFCRQEQKVPYYYEKGYVVKCKVERVKKGSLYLSSSEDKSFDGFERGTYYPFRIVDIRYLKDDIRYFILEDKNGKPYLLKHEYYTKYGFSKEEEILCEVQKMSSEGYYVIEPKHPYYELNGKYPFTFIKSAKDSKTHITGLYEVTVQDQFGQEVKFMSGDPLFKRDAIAQYIECEVIGIKKGKPVLNFCSEVRS